MNKIACVLSFPDFFQNFSFYARNRPKTAVFIIKVSRMTRITRIFLADGACCLNQDLQDFRICRIQERASQSAFICNPSVFVIYSI